MNATKMMYAFIQGTTLYLVKNYGDFRQSQRLGHLEGIPGETCPFDFAQVVIHGNLAATTQY